LTFVRVTYTAVGLVTLDCTHGVINPLYHCRHSARDMQYKFDRAVSDISLLLLQ